MTGGNASIASPISQDNDIGIDGNNNQVNQDNSINQTIDSRISLTTVAITVEAAASLITRAVRVKASCMTRP